MEKKCTQREKIELIESDWRQKQNSKIQVAGVSRHPDRPIAFKVQIPFHCFSQTMHRMETTIRTQTFRLRSRHALECTTCHQAVHLARPIIICHRRVRAR